MTDSSRDRRLDAETLAAYVDGRLPPEARARVDAEIAADPDLCEWLTGTLTAVDALKEHPAPARLPVPDRPLVEAGSRGRAPRWAMAAGAALAGATVVLLVTGLPPSWRSRPSNRPAIADLIAVAGTERFIEARFSGGFPHVARPPVMRGREAAANQHLELLAVADELRRRAAGDGDPDVRRAWGIVQLMAGDLDNGVATLRALHDQRPNDSAASDLAAGLVELGRATGDRRALAEAHELLAPLVAGPAPPAEALFNDALALDALGLPAAGAAWRRVVATDPDPGWRAEATERLRRWPRP
ncbi:MAG: hypothetical protein AB7U83_14605 [Vicinamibacterales bacterium]